MGHPSDKALCEQVLLRLARLRSIGAQRLLGLPEEEHETIFVQGQHARLSVIREPSVGGGAVVVVQGFLPTWSRPTFISLTSLQVGRLVAEGLVVGPQGEITDAPDHVMWDFR